MLKTWHIGVGNGCYVVAMSGKKSLDRGSFKKRRLHVSCSWCDRNQCLDTQNQRWRRIIPIQFPGVDHGTRTPMRRCPCRVRDPRTILGRRFLVHVHLAYLRVAKRTFRTTPVQRFSVGGDGYSPSLAPSPSHRPLLDTDEPVAATGFRSHSWPTSSMTGQSMATASSARTSTTFSAA